MAEPVDVITASVVPATAATNIESSFIKTTTGNYVSRQAEIHHPKNVEIKGRSWIEEGVIIRGDLAKVRMGRYCKLSRGTLVQPAPSIPTSNEKTTNPPSLSSSQPDSSSSASSSSPHVPVVIGSHTVIGQNCQIRAAAVGSYCWIGSHVCLGPRVIIKDACVIEDGVILGDDTVIPPFTRVAKWTIPNCNPNQFAFLPPPPPPYPPVVANDDDDKASTKSTTTNRVTTTELLQMIELPPATIQLLQEESMEIYNLHRQGLVQSPV